MVSQITGKSAPYSAIGSGQQQRKDQALLAFMGWESTGNTQMYLDFLTK